MWSCMPIKVTPRRTKECRTAVWLKKMQRLTTTLSAQCRRKPGWTKSRFCIGWSSFGSSCLWVATQHVYLDLCAAHETATIEETLGDLGTKVLYIPMDLSNRLQVLDVGVNNIIFCTFRDNTPLCTDFKCTPNWEETYCAAFRGQHKPHFTLFRELDGLSKEGCVLSINVHYTRIHCMLASRNIGLKSGPL